MSFRVKLLSWIVAVNLGITALLLVAVLSNINRQSQGYRRSAEVIAGQRGEIFDRLEDILGFQKAISEKEEADFSAVSMIFHWTEWRNYRDAMVLLDYTKLDREIIHTDILLNPLGRLHRTFDDEQAEVAEPVELRPTEH